MAQGIFRLHLNGFPVDDSYFTPGWTDYARRLCFNAFDVTALLRPGANALGAVVADGWYAGASAGVRYPSGATAGVVLAMLPSQTARGTCSGQKVL